MVLAAPPPTPNKLLTYEDYMSEGEVNQRYDIIDGVRIFMTQPTDRHQDIVLNIAELLRGYQRKARTGKAMIAPCDVQITINPLRTRQPDVLFISRERYGVRSADDAHPFSPAPELVVEVLSPSDTRSVRLGKISDYCAVGVRECWLVSPQAETVEILRITRDGAEHTAFYGADQTLQSITFPDMTLALDDIFRIED